jgi:hypothetical protein
MFMANTSQLLLKECVHASTHACKTQLNKMFLLCNMSVSYSFWSHTNTFVTFL